MRILNRTLLFALIVGLAAGAAFSSAAGPHFAAWGAAQKIDEVAGNHADLNTASLDGCPIQSPDGLSLYMASNRPGGMGGLDIWVATRERASGPWGAPANLPAPINSASDDFCPTPVRGKGLFFVSRRVVAGVTCGLGDIYFTRRNPAHGWSDPEHLGCDPAGPNSALDEQGPSYVARTPVLLALRTAPREHGRALRQREARRHELRRSVAHRRAERRGCERHPAERAQGRSRDRLLFEPRRRARRSGHLVCDTRRRRRPLVCAGESRLERQHGLRRVAARPLLGCAAAPLRPSRPGWNRRGRNWRIGHLRNDPGESRQLNGRPVAGPTNRLGNLSTEAHHA